MKTRMMHLFLEEHQTIYYIAGDRFLQYCPSFFFFFFFSFFCSLFKCKSFLWFQETKAKKEKNYTEVKSNGSLTKFAKARIKPFNMN